MKYKFRDILKRYFPIAIAAIIGAGAGYLYYLFVGCASGTCVITSNPVISTLYFALLGGLLGRIISDRSFKRKNRKEEEHE